MERLIAAASALGEQVAGAAEPSGPGLTWHAEIMVGTELAHGEVGTALYDGTAGIAVGLAAVPGLATAARGAALHALAGADELLETGRVGFFDGAAGIAWSAVTTGRALNDAALVARGEALAARITALPAELDLISGAAGTLLGLLALGRTLPAAGHLIAAARPQTWGAAWGDPPLLGLGHGAAGIALALAEYAHLTGDERAAACAAQGLEYERGLYDPDRVAWPDLREDQVGWMAAWCHGAIGIGISRVRIAHLTRDPRAIAEASAALQAARDLVVAAGTALRDGATSDCTACHGLGGVVEFLLLAERGLGVPDHGRAAQRVAQLMLEQRERVGRWPCGLPDAGEIPGLMTGLSGIALTLLRAARATTIPTPLLPGPSGW